MAAFFCRKANAKRQRSDCFGRVTASGTEGERIRFVTGNTVCALCGFHDSSIGLDRHGLIFSYI